MFVPLKRVAEILLLCFVALAVAGMGQWRVDASGNDTGASGTPSFTVAAPQKAPLAAIQGSAGGFCCACATERACTWRANVSVPVLLRLTVAHMPPAGPVLAVPEAPPRI